MKINLRRFSFRKIYDFVNNYHLRISAIVFIVLIALNVCIYFKYIYLVTNRVKLDSEVEEVTIDQETLQKVFDNLDIREANQKRVEQAEYKDPFR